MPKQLYKITQFHGGLNSNSDPRDIAENELSEAKDVMVDELGKIRMMGGNTSTYTANAAAITAGYGLFSFSHDRVGGSAGDLEHLSESAAPSSSHWGATGGGTFSSNLTHTHATNATSTFTQTAANRAIKGVGACNYKFTYTVASPTGSDSDITDFKIVGGGSNFAATNTNLTQTDGTHETTFLSAQSAADEPFVISITTSGTAVITIDDMSLKVFNAQVTGDNYLAMADADGAASPDGGIDIFSLNSQAWNSAVIHLGTTTGMKPTFYIVDGALRVSDGNFGANNTSKWYGYINRKHIILQNLDPTDYNVNNGDTMYSYNGWYAKDQECTAPTRGLVGGWGDPDAIEGGDSATWSTQNTPRLLQGTATGGSTTTLIDNAATGSNGGFKNYLAADFDGKGYIAVNYSHDEAAIIDEWVDEDTLSMDPAMPSNPFAASDLYFIYPPAGTGLNIAVHTDTAGTFNSSGSDKYYQVGAVFTYEGSGESAMYEYGNSRIKIANNCDLEVRILCTAPFDPRISGARVYIKKKDGRTLTDTDGIWYLLMDIDMAKGARADIFGDNYSGWITAHGWGATTSNPRLYFDLAMTFISEPVMTRDSVIGYNFANQTTSVKYKTAVVANRRAYIGNVQYVDQGSITHTKGDAIIKSPVNQFDTFPTTGLLETSINDGDDIIKLETYADRLLIFKKNKLELLNISQEVEFLEDTFMYKGVSHPAATCKTDFGIAWVNERGCYIYDGQKVNNLLEKQGRQIIKESDWLAFTTDESMIGYFPKKRQLIVVDDMSSGNDGEIFLYDLVTQSWVHSSGSTFIDDQDLTNFVTDWNGDLIHAEEDAGTILKWDDAADPSAAVDIKTKDIDFGNPGQVKRIYKFYVTHRGYASNIQTAYSINGNAGTFIETISGTELPLSDPTTDWITTEIVPTAAPIECKSIRFRLFSDQTTPANFEINDITIVYRLKGMR